jgi:hypothetical protein
MGVKVDFVMKSALKPRNRKAKPEGGDVEGMWRFFEAAKNIPTFIQKRYPEIP